MILLLLRMVGRVSSADRPELEGGYQYHVRVKKGDLPETVLLPGDPERVEKIISLLDDGTIITRHRGLVVGKGLYKNVEIGVACSGMGAPSTAIVVEELARVGVKNIIRVGSTGAIQPYVNVGDIIIAIGAVRLEGTSKQYVIAEYPAISDLELTLKLIHSAKTLGVKYHVGIVASTDSFYTGQGREGYDGYKQSWMSNLISDLSRANVLSFEMESSLLFVLGRLYKLRTGSVLAVFANRITNEFRIAGELEAIKVALESSKLLSL